ncbi:MULTISPECIES: acyl-CoA thioesterase [unclassified Rhodococcus (in: high G+C Gram-positive bacteria)]|uniref:acyl-CoA thioesterase n=1 Tax=unclassified Rhodococcus (in: high G+C Gram-positive bacteria) TaxID=192944 RepID=UPI0006F9B04D|nr:MULTISPECIES: thioesterase family protein [unclassified Rhodococcus (in: high G+C Gram-positive bacteria)]KQU32049.1 acyl-CoA thioesterase [Rhodococcus sp. Leaf225]KQU41216.1 acyl-CoA thioesterase [Rhodococcus sp. Leaf258]
MTHPGSHAFDDGLTLEPLGDGRYRGRTSAPYNNMVGPFGGLTAATLVRAVELHPDRLGDPVTLTVNFAGPIAEGEFEIFTRAVRTNRSNQHWYLELSQDGTVATTATAVFGTRRTTWDALESSPPAMPDPADVDTVDFPEFIAWANNYEMRFTAGALTETESADSVATLWVRDSPPRPMDFASLTSMSDIFYPRVFQRRGKYVAAGTISLTVHYFATAEDLAAQYDGYVLGTAHARRFHQGYFDQTAELWSTSGTLLATGHQVVYYKD